MSWFAGPAAISAESRSINCVGVPLTASVRSVPDLMSVDPGPAANII
jgi:hypothetical protein